MSDHKDERTCGKCASFRAADPAAAGSGCFKGCCLKTDPACDDFTPADAPTAEPARFTAFQFSGESHQSEPVPQPHPTLPDGTYRVVCGELVLVVPGVPPELGLPDAEPVPPAPGHHEYCSRGVGPRRDCHVCRGFDATTTALPAAGPEPASETPWAAFRWADSDECQIDSVARGFRGVAKKLCEKDAAAIVHRVNNYPALHAHAVRLQAEVERLRGALPGGQE